MSRLWIVAAVLAVLAMVEAVLWDPGGPPAAMLLPLAATLPMAVAGSQVVAAAYAGATATFLAMLVQERSTVAGLVALAWLVYLLGRDRSWEFTAPLLLPFFGLAGFGTGPAVVPLGAAGLGMIRRARKKAAERDRARLTFAESAVEHAARGERARIARELHDVVAHHLSMIAVQAETARLATPGMPAEGSKRLLAIGDTTRAALTEMRRLLGVLREDAGTTLTRTPQPGLPQLLELIDEVRESARASTRLIVHGKVTPLDPGVELAAYRIVQEALTNARRHAPDAAVDVELGYLGDTLHLRIRDNGPGPGGPSGHGLLGMTERAAMIGGTLSTGPSPTGGFLVEARLPAAP